MSNLNGVSSRILVFMFLALVLFSISCADSNKNNNKPTERANQEPDLSKTDVTKVEEKESVPLPFPIAFTSERDGNKEIYLAIDASREPINISNHESDDDHFLPYRDGGVFISQRDGDHDIYYIHYSPECLIENLTANPSIEKQMAVSFDRENLLFTSSRDLDIDIFLFLREGFPARNLTRNQASDEFPVWMPDGERFLFESDRSGDFDIYVQAVDGGAAKNLTNSPCNERFPSISPSGKFLAFESDCDGYEKIYLYRFDDNSVECLSGDLGTENSPLFSWDERYLAFNHVEGKMIRVEVLDLTSRKKTVIVDFEQSCGVSGFSPDNEWLMYVSKRSGNFDVYIRELKSEREINVTNHHGSDYYPVFLPSVTYPLVLSLIKK